MLESIADEPKKPQDKNDPQKAERLRNENVSDKPPDFAVAEALRVEVERGYEIRIQAHKEEDERAERMLRPARGADSLLA